MVQDWVRSCETCQRNKMETLRPASVLQPLDVPSQVWADISMNFIEGLPKVGGKSVILTVVDRFSKYAHFIALGHPYTASSVARAFFDGIVRLHGFPSPIVCDRDPVFTGHVWRDLFRMAGVQLRFSMAFHPQTDGQSEGHLLTNGFMHGHTQWMSDDGAEVNGATAAGGNNGRLEGGHHDIDADEEFVAQDDNLEDDNNLDNDEEVPLASVVRDPHLQDLLLEKTKGAKRKSKLEQLEIDSNTPLYDSGRGLGESRLRVALDVLQMKAKHGWTDTSVDDILEYVKDLLPAGNTCPGSLAEAKRITCPLDIPHEKYHACINDCIMYRNEHMDKTKCPV
ncbi:hypothetical protein QYE76_049452 [Lolium multiflorum]|uniref:Integrase catalytic domain-containing protein n=1 Tax=Lolium multiflorum TaxID=4521 RepID=A0AAD8SQ48_LOLMU|nr:hypothetical protein QYE76_049452 [Lolium multiflorum]